MIDSAAVGIDNRLSFTDQLLFLGQRATGQELVMQAVWVYEHPVDLNRVERFHQNFGYGLFGRRIERSPLKFGRHRWVSSQGAPAAMDVAECARPRAELGDWADERALLPIDPERGPGWHLGVLPMTDGSTGISLVMSHCLADGFGALLTISDGIKGNRRDLGYPPPGSRGRFRGAMTDLRDTVQGAPETARALTTAIRQMVRRRHELLGSGAPQRPVTAGEAGQHSVVVPAITVHVDLDDWDARAKALNGTSHALVAGFAAKLAQQIGRVRASDGAVTLTIPISDRTPDDTRANAVLLADASLNPIDIAADLSGARAAIKQTLKTIRDVPDETLGLLPLTPFLPRRAVKRGSGIVFGFDDLPVSCSNLGDVDRVVGRLDGTDAEYMMLRGVDRYVTRQTLEQRGGLLTILAGRIVGKISIAVIGYMPGRENSKPLLGEMAAKTLADFGLVGAIE